MKTRSIQGQLLPTARADAGRQAEAATEVTGNSGLDQRIGMGPEELGDRGERASGCAERWNQEDFLVIWALPPGCLLSFKSLPRTFGFPR